jgi:toxin ParE1/3/4
MANYKLTRRAVDDISKIWLYTYETWSERQADKYYSLLIDTIRELSTKPEFGRSYSMVDPGLRGVKVGRHIIFYLTESSQEILVVRILHEQMDLLNKFN